MIRRPRTLDPGSLARRLKEAAAAHAPAPPPELRPRILEAVRRASRDPLRAGHGGVERRALVLAAAAAVLALAGAWWLTRAPSADPQPELVVLSRDLLDAGALVFALPTRVEGDLRLETERLLADTTRVAAGVVRGLPGPLRSRLEGR
jgi:hypothetical protein